MTSTMPLPDDSGGPDEFADRAPDRVLEQTQTEIDGDPEAEDLDEADAEHRLDLDPEEQRNATDPAHDEGEDAPG